MCGISCSLPSPLNIPLPLYFISCDSIINPKKCSLFLLVIQFEFSFLCSLFFENAHLWWWKHQMLRNLSFRGIIHVFFPSHWHRKKKKTQIRSGGGGRRIHDRRRGKVIFSLSWILKRGFFMFTDDPTTNDWSVILWSPVGELAGWRVVAVIAEEVAWERRSTFMPQIPVPAGQPFFLIMKGNKKSDWRPFLHFFFSFHQPHLILINCWSSPSFSSLCFPHNMRDTIERQEERAEQTGRGMKRPFFSLDHESSQAIVGVIRFSVQWKEPPAGWWWWRGSQISLWKGDKEGKLTLVSKHYGTSDWAGEQKRRYTIPDSSAIT
jgi:hypothetical protein